MSQATDAPAALLERAAAAGFDGVELLLDDEGPHSALSNIRQFANVRTLAGELGLAVVSLATDSRSDVHLASADVALRQTARERTIALLERAAAAGAAAVRVSPGVVGSGIAYADVWERSLAAMLELRHDAEAFGVTIAIDPADSRFLLSPIELCDYLDEINSPYVSACLDLGHAAGLGCPADWARTLGRRVCLVRATHRPDAPIDWSAVMAALREIGYDGALIGDGAGEPMEIRRRLTQAMASGPQSAEDSTTA